MGIINLMDADETGVNIRNHLSDELLTTKKDATQFTQSKRKKTLYALGLLILLLTVIIGLRGVFMGKDETIDTTSPGNLLVEFEIGSIISKFRERYPDLEWSYASDSYAITVGNDRSVFDWDSYSFGFTAYDESWASFIQAELILYGFEIVNDSNGYPDVPYELIYQRDRSLCTISVSSPNQFEAGGFTFACTSDNQNADITDDPEKYVSGEFASCAEVNLQGRYLFRREQWNEENRLKAENHICAVHPLLVEYYGEPFNTERPIKLLLDMPGVGEYSGMSNIDTITLASVDGESSFETFTHELVHAFRGETHFLYSVFEEGSARAMQVFITNKLGKESKVVDARMQLASLLNQKHMTTNAGGIREDDGTTDVAGLRYQLAGVAFLKVIQEDPYFFRKFHERYYPAYREDPSIQSDYGSIVDLIAEVKPIIEGVPAKTWFEGLNVFQTNNSLQQDYPYMYFFTGAAQNAFTVQPLVKYLTHESVYRLPIRVMGEITFSDNISAQQFTLDLNKRCEGNKEDPDCSHINNYVEISYSPDYIGPYRVTMDVIDDMGLEFRVEPYVQYGFFNLESAQSGLYGVTEDTDIVRLYDASESLISEVTVIDNSFVVDGLPSGTYTLTDGTGNKRLVVTKVTDVQVVQF